MKDIIIQMKDFRESVKNNKPKDVVPPSLLKKCFDELGYKRTYDATGKLLGFIGLKNFPDEIRKVVPPIKIKREHEWCRDIEYLLKAIPELSEIYALNKKDEVIFSDKLSEEEKKQLIDYVGEHDELVLIQGRTETTPMTEKIIRNVKEYFASRKAPLPAPDEKK